MVPNVNGTVRIGQFVDSFSIPRVTVRMEGLERPLEILCGKLLHDKLEQMDASDLKDAKLRDSMGKESGRWPVSRTGGAMPSSDGGLIPCLAPALGFVFWTQRV